MSKRKQQLELLPAAEVGQPLVPARLWALLAIVPVFIVFLASDFRPALYDSPYPDYRVLANGDALAGLLAGLDLVEEDDEEDWDEVALAGRWGATRGGITLGDFEEPASVTVRLLPADWDAAEVRIAGDRRVAWGIRVSWVEGYGLNRSIVSNTPVLSFRPGEVVRFEAEDVPGLMVATEPISITLTPREPDAGAVALRGPVLTGVDVRATSDTRNPLPYLPDYVGMALLPFLAAMVLRVGFGFSAHRCFAGGLGFGILGFLVASGQADQGESGVAWAIAIGAAVAGVGNAALGIAGVRRHPRLPASLSRGDWLETGGTLALILVVLVSVGPVWDAFAAERRTELGPPGAVLVDSARGGAGELADSQRPVPVLNAGALAMWYRVAPPSDSSARFFGLLVFVVATALAFEVARRVASLGAGLFGAVLYALASRRISSAIQVEMLDAIIVLAFGLVLAHFAWKQRPVLRAVAWGLLGGGLILAAPWASLLVAIGLAWAYFDARSREWPWGPGELSAAGVAILAAVIGPMMAVGAPGPDWWWGLGGAAYGLGLWAGLVAFGFVGGKVVVFVATKTLTRVRRAP